MRRLIILILGTIIFNVVYSQEYSKNIIDEGVNRVNRKVDSIDSFICYKALYDYRGFRVRNESDIFDWLVVLYYDEGGKILKSKVLFCYPEEEGSYGFYFNKKGIAIQSYISTFSGMNNSFFILKYLNDDERLLYIDFLRKDDDAGGIVVEHTQLSGGYNLKTPQMSDVEIFKNVSNIKSFTNDIKKLFHKDGILDLSMPHKVDSVCFVKARLGDKTIINNNCVPLFKDSIGSHTPLIDLHVGYNIEILEVNDKWNKIKELNTANQFIGYVESRYLAPVEVCLKNCIEIK